MNLEWRHAHHEACPMKYQERQMNTCLSGAPRPKTRPRVMMHMYFMCVLRVLVITPLPTWLDNMGVPLWFYLDFVF